jgi:hypothetical protein
MTLPILIPCYNNWKYVENMIRQLVRINPELAKWIKIMNNSSTCEETIQYLENCDYTVIQNVNNGPWVNRKINTHIWNKLPSKFILTDPDLQFHPDVPSNFIDILSELSDKYQAEKMGLALDISEPDTMIDKDTILFFENQYWKNLVENAPYEMYYAPIDTTFALINKNYEKTSIRVAGVFTVKHLPWYKENIIYTPEENYHYNKITAKYSSFSKVILQYLSSQKLDKKLADETTATTP